MSFEEIYIVGGLNNKKYQRLQTEFKLLSTNPTALTTHAAEPVSEDVRAFSRSIKYVNLY